MTTIVHRLWLRIGKFYLDRRSLERAVKFYRKGQDAITKLSERLSYADLLHASGYADEALSYIGHVIAISGSSAAYERRAHILRELSREEEAILDLDEAIKLNSDNYLSWYTRGLAYKDLGKYEESIHDFHESMTREDEDTIISTYYELAMAYYRSGNMKDAIFYFKKSISIPDKVCPNYYFMLSLSLYEQENMELSLSYLLQGIALLNAYEACPDDGYSIFSTSTNYSYGAFLTFRNESTRSYSYRWLLSDIYLNLDQDEQALNAINEAIDKYPNDYELLLKRATILKNLGKVSAAEEDLKQAGSIDPDQLRAYFDLASLYREQGKEDQAFAVVSSLYSHHYDSTIVCYWMADAYYRAGQYEEALNINDKLLLLEKEDVLNYLQRADICMAMDDLKSAEQAVVGALQLQDTPSIRSRYSHVLYMLDRYEEAQQELQQAVILDPSFTDDAVYWVASGHIYRALNILNLAIHDYSRAIELDATSAQLYKFRAECYVETEEYELGIADCTHGLQLDPDYRILYSLRNTLYYLTGNYDQAISDISQYIAVHSDDPAAYYLLGQSHYKNNDEQAALVAFEHVLDCNPGHASSYLYKAHIYYDQFEWNEAIQAIVDWSLNLGAEVTAQEKIEGIQALEGFDESLLEKAVDRLTERYGYMLYLS